MKEGDLIKIERCARPIVGMSCACFLCHGGSSRIGIVLEAFEQPARYHGCVLFDLGTHWVPQNYDVKVIDESR